jgi:hypothetical protein
VDTEAVDETLRSRWKSRVRRDFEEVPGARRRRGVDLMHEAHGVMIPHAKGTVQLLGTVRNAGCIAGMQIRN